jgi:hypothetical protein
VWQSRNNCPYKVAYPNISLSKTPQFRGKASILFVYRLYHSGHEYRDSKILRSLTSTFIVRRDGLVLSGSAHGWNETPNNEQDLHVKVRNTVIALMARVCLSGAQWQKLVNGLID